MAAQCNGGTTVTSTITISASCAGGGAKPLSLDTGANVTVNAGVTVSNDAGGGRNGDPVSILGTATTSTLTNNGIISTASQWGVTVNGTLTSLVNAGTISSGVRRGVITNGGTIVTLTNTGSITGPFAGVTVSGGAIQTFNNLQGAGNGNGAVTYSGTLPSNYNIIINSAATYGKLTSSGATGSTTFGVYGTSVVATGTYATVLSGFTASNLNSTTGQFGWFDWTLSPNAGTPTNWDLTFSRRSLVAAITGSSNTPAVGAASVLERIANGEITATADMTSVITAMGQLSTAADLNKAVTQTLPLMTGGMGQVIAGVLHNINGVVQTRQESNRGLSSGDTFYGDQKFWMKPFGSWADQNDRKGVSGFKSRTGGLAFGADATISDDTRLGVSFAYAKADVAGNATTAPNSAYVDVYQLVGYGSHSLDPNTELNFQAGIGQNKNEGQRSILLTGTTAKANYASLTATAGVGVGRRYTLSEQTRLTPSLRVDYTRIRDAGYTETGAGALNLNVQGHSSDELTLAIDGKIAHEIDKGTTVTANLGAGYDALNKQASITATFAGAPGAAFTTKGLEPSPWLLRAGLGIAKATRSGMEVLAHYDAEYRKDFLNQTASVKLRWAF